FRIQDFFATGTVSDFNAGAGDSIDVSSLLAAYNPGTDTLQDFVEIVTSGSNSTLRIDQDGSGGVYSMTNMITISGVTGLTDENALVSAGSLIVGGTLYGSATGDELN